MINMFTYGSLMVDRVWQRVLKIESLQMHRNMPAVLWHHQRFCVDGETYPGLASKPEAIVQGILYFDLSPEQVRVLDHFEGPEYRRGAVEVEAAGAYVSAQVYLHTRPERLTQQVWTLANFDEAKFMKQYVGFTDTP
jgi:gamma-glutamylcyclotransferase (GGCT)/AIG2-like uncharacterized protein YtfP